MKLNIMMPVFKFSVIICMVFLSLLNANRELFVTHVYIDEFYFVPDDKEIEITVLEEINSYRESNGLTPFIKLNAIKHQAYRHTESMLENNSLSHVDFISRSNFLKKNANAASVGENLAVGFQSPSDLLQAWLVSESSKKIIEGDYTHFNISAEQSEDGTWFYTSIFIKK